MRKSLCKKYIVLVFSGLSLFFYPNSGFPSETDLQSGSKLSWVIKNIKEKEKSLKTFTAKFVQTKKTCLLQEPLHSEGLIYFDFTGKMLLEVTDPTPLKFLFRDNLMIIHDPDLSKAKKRRLGKSDNILKKYFGVGQSVEELKKRYEIQLTSKTLLGNYHLKLIPKMRAIARHIDTIEVVVNPKDWLPERIHFKEVKGDHTSLQLQFTSINEPLPRGIFTINALVDNESDP